MGRRGLMAAAAVWLSAAAAAPLGAHSAAAHSAAARPPPRDGTGAPRPPVHWARRIGFCFASVW